MATIGKAAIESGAPVLFRTVSGKLGVAGRGLNDLTTEWSPSRFWHQGGPIIERERINVSCGKRGDWWASMALNEKIEGPTPLIAAMRAFVASKFGEEVEL